MKLVSAISLLIAAAVLAGTLWLVVSMTGTAELFGGLEEGPTACTLEAKQCPDGSFVGRTGSNCEFAECPVAPPEPEPIYCTQDVKECPDGSFVGRTGSNCEFAECPVALPEPEPIYCTQDVKECPDGSFVGRKPPTCEFAACPAPATRATGTLQGTMTIGPICPVETYPPYQECKPSAEAFAARKVYVWSADRSRLIATLTPDAEGRFSAVLPVGTYIVDVERQPIGGATGVPAAIVIKSGQTAPISIDIDTGIR